MRQFGYRWAYAFKLGESYSLWGFACRRLKSSGTVPARGAAGFSLVSSPCRREERLGLWRESGSPRQRASCGILSGFVPRSGVVTVGGLPSLKSILREGSTSAHMQGFCRAFKRGVDAGFVLVMSLPAAASAAGACLHHAYPLRRSLLLRVQLLFVTMSGFAGYTALYMARLGAQPGGGAAGAGCRPSAGGRTRSGALRLKFMRSCGEAPTGAAACHSPLCGPVRVFRGSAACL